MICGSYNKIMLYTGKGEDGKTRIFASEARDLGIRMSPCLAIIWYAIVMQHGTFPVALQNVK
jgi:hypothetical protein